MTCDFTALETTLSDSLSLPNQPEGFAFKAWRDWAGIIASTGCAIHCAMMPFAIAYLPTLGLSFLANESFHKWTALVCFALSLTAFAPGLRKHRRLIPVIVGSIGLALILVAAFGFDDKCCVTLPSNAAAYGTNCVDTCCTHITKKTLPRAGDRTDAADSPSNTESAMTSSGSTIFASWLTPFGSLALIGAHLLNRHYSCHCPCCSSEASEPTV